MGKKSKLYLHNLQTRDMKNAGNCKREAFKNSGSLPHPLWAPLSVKEQELLQGPAWRQREKVLTQSQTFWNFGIWKNWNFILDKVGLLCQRNFNSFESSKLKTAKWC